MSDSIKFFDSIYNSDFHSIMESARMDAEQKKAKLIELEGKIKDIPAYKAGEDKSFVQSANTILKKISEALNNLK